MPLRVVISVAVLATLLISAPPSASALSAGKHRVGLILHDHVKVYRSPSTTSSVVATLVQQTQVEVLATRGSWAHVTIWASVKGWVAKGEVTFRKPWDSVSNYHAPEIHYHVHAHAAQPIQVHAQTTASVQLMSRPGGSAVGTVPAGLTVNVSGWQQDSSGKVWYRMGNAWGRGDAVQFRGPDPAVATSNHLPVWRPVSGKGMWLTLGTTTGNDPDVVIRAAQRNGISHLYLEAAISPLGFHGKQVVGPLVDAAHRHGMTIVAWVYPYLYDVAADVALTRQVAGFRTPSGQRFDGVAADVERDVYLWNVRAYSQLVRYYLGPSYLLVGVTYPPQSFPTFPFGEMARSYNVLAPMDYWHQTKTETGLDYGHMRYGYDYGYRYALDSIRAIRATGVHVPIAPIGQTFDDFGRLEMGPHAPSQAEITGFLQGSRAGGAIGASFFQWMTATDSEWHAIHDFRF